VGCFRLQDFSEAALAPARSGSMLYLFAPLADAFADFFIQARVSPFSHFALFLHLFFLYESRILFVAKWSFRRKKKVLDIRSRLFSLMFSAAEAN
jgi:hypothetical protein